MAYNSSRNTNYAIRNMSETNGGFMLSTHTTKKKLQNTIPGNCSSNLVDKVL